MDLQTGVAVYQFVRDRQDDLRDEQHPEGHDAYVRSWREAHDLSQDYASAVHAGHPDAAARFLNALTDMACQWESHPDYHLIPDGLRPGHGAS